MGALEASRDTETGQEASRAAPIPGPTVEGGARTAMADPGIRGAMADQETLWPWPGHTGHGYIAPSPKFSWEDPSLGGTLEARTLGGALEAQTHESALKAQTHGGALEARTIGGAVEEQAQEGAVEERAQDLGEPRPAGLPYSLPAGLPYSLPAGFGEPRTMESI